MFLEVARYMVKERACEKCNKNVPSSDVKLMFRGKGSLMALCSECRAKVGIVEKSSSVKAVPEKRPYYCGKCRYKFKFDPSSGAKLSCPYCGDHRYVIEHTYLTTDTLVKNADKE